MRRWLRFLWGLPAPVRGGTPPLGTWALLFTRHRLLARTSGGIQEWSALTGPTPGQLLREDDGASVEVFPSRDRYDRVLVAGRQFWVHRRYRHTVQDWAAEGGSS